MAATNVAVNQETSSSALIATNGPFEPCVWGDFFATYSPPPSQSQRSQEWMRERANQLKGEVRRMFEVGKAMSTAGMVTLVDRLERLGIDTYFYEEINSALSRVHSDVELEFGGCDDLHIAALMFRLLRQHGFWVSADVFNKFRDARGCFFTSLCRYPSGLLSLYNAAHMATPDEVALDDAITFARCHLEASKGKLGSPMAEQVSRALDIPLPRFMRRLETMYYITEYEQEVSHDVVLLELARLEFNLVRCLQLKELKALSIWWRDLYGDVKLGYSRDRIVEMYFWTYGMFPGEDNSRARIILTKTIGLTTLMDDTYDVHASFQECLKFDEAIQRWDESMVSILPEYLRMVYIRTLSNFKEFNDMLEPHEKHRMSYAQEQYKLQSKYYLQEAKWTNENHTPAFKEHVAVTAKSTGLPMLSVVALMGAGQVVSEEVFQWAVGMPDMFIACGEIGRFLNDIASYKKGKNRKDVVSSLECYMKEHGATGEEAAAALAAMVEHAWRRINRACVEMDSEVLTAARLVVDLTRTLEIVYLRGRDAYTFGRYLKDLITPLFLKPVPV